MAKPIKWTEERTEILRYMRVELKKPYAVIADLLGVSPCSVEEKCRRMDLLNPNPKLFEVHAKKKVTDLRRATLEHLLDLKRAGHSPRQTEFRIEPERRTPMVINPPALSYCGSPSAMCAEG